MDKSKSLPSCAERLAEFELENSRLAESMLPAELSAAAYGELSWAWEVAAGAPVEAWAPSLKEGLHNLPRALFLRSVVAPVGAEELGIDAKSHGAVFERGVWSSGSLAQAICAKASDGAGGTEIHLSIRGTDPASDASATRSLLNTVFGYLLWTYPRINIHGEQFEALAKAIANHASDPANKVTKIVLSGHSLGAAGAEAILPLLKKSGVEVKSHFFGNPGRGPGWSTLAFTGLRATVSVASSLFSGVVGAIPEHWGKTRAFAGIVGEPIAMASRLLNSIGRRPDENIINWRNSGDPVPKIGSLLYASDGLARKVSWEPINDAKWWQIWRVGALAKAAFDCHPMANYAMANARKLRGILNVGGKVSPLAMSRWEAYGRALREADAMRQSMASGGMDEKSVSQARAAVIAEGAAWPTMQGARLQKLAKAEPIGKESMTAFKEAAVAQRELVAEIAEPTRKSFTSWLVARRLIGKSDGDANQWGGDSEAAKWSSEP